MCSPSRVRLWTVSSCSADEDCSDQKLSMKDVGAALTAPVISFRGSYVHHRLGITFRLTFEVRAGKRHCRARRQLLHGYSVCLCFHNHTAVFKLLSLLPDGPAQLARRFTGTTAKSGQLFSGAVQQSDNN